MDNTVPKPVFDYVKKTVLDECSAMKIKEVIAYSLNSPILDKAKIDTLHALDLIKILDGIIDNHRKYNEGLDIDMLDSVESLYKSEDLELHSNDGDLTDD